MSDTLQERLKKLKAKAAEVAFRPNIVDFFVALDLARDAIAAEGAAIAEVTRLRAVAEAGNLVVEGCDLPKAAYSKVERRALSRPRVALAALTPKEEA